LILSKPSTRSFSGEPMTGFKKALTLILLAAMCCVLCGCGEKKADSLAITLEGREISSLDLTAGSKQSGISAVVSPAGFEGEVTWSSEDSGIVKISENGGEVTLSAVKTGSAKITAEVGGVSTYIRVHVEKNYDDLALRDTAVIVNGVSYPVEVMNIYYAQEYYDIVETYGEYAAYYGLDITQGIGSLGEQASDYSDDGTWRGYFIDAALNKLSQVKALCAYGEENGITLSEEELAGIDTYLAETEAAAKESGYESLDSYLADHYGKGVTTAFLRSYLEENKLSEKAYNQYYAGLSYSDEEIAAHYAELGYSEDENNYRVASMRHILIMAEADENGSCSEEAIAAAHERAEEIYAEWQSGDMTEESFAELANLYSEDSGSNTKGGLYTELYQGYLIDGIDSWLFGEEREVGDTVVVDNNGSYTGTHIVYFSGYGELYSTLISVSDLKSTAVSAWFEEICSDYIPQAGGAYSEIGNI